MPLAGYVIVCLVIIGLLWRNFMKYKEIALMVTKKAAEKKSVDLLDDTVCLRKIKFSFSEGKLIVYRKYSFDFNIMESFERYRGFIVLKGHFLEELNLPNNPKPVFDKDFVNKDDDNQAAPKRKVANKVISFD